ncbi:MAG TPA: hypothetical protein VKB36_18740 [Vicinamibacterales bacterium]|nr:hypothetical protein [Vicinamibacterales bacterium]
MRSTPLQVSTLTLAVMLASRAPEAESQTPMNRVRATSAAIANEVAHARQWSPTFRALIDAINATDGLVYIEEGECRGHVRACLVHAVTVAGPHRLLHIKIDPRRNNFDTRDVDPDVVGLLGHELQHAAEVLRDPHLRTNADIANFYMREGTFSTGTVIETLEAERAGVVIADEVRRARKNRLNH